MTASTGLGLTFSKMAVEAHGGVIGVDSPPGQGATFWIRLPGACLIDNPNPAETAQALLTSFQFTHEERTILKPYAARLMELKIYKVTAIRKVLNEIQYHSERVNTWKSRIKEAVNTGYGENYKTILESVNESAGQ